MQMKKMLSEKYDELTADMNISLYDELLDKHNNSIFSKRPAAVGKTETGKRRFHLPQDGRQIPGKPRYSAVLRPKAL